MDTVSLVLAAFVKALLVTLTAGSVFLILYYKRKHLGFVLAIWQRFTFLMFLEVLTVVVVTLTLGTVVQVYLPWLWIGWLHLLIEGGGNANIAPILEGKDSPWFVVRLFVPLFFLAFLVAIPFIAKLEEELFRKRKHEWSKIWRSSLVFGFVHCIVGVPIGVGFLLSGVGFFYAWKYRSAYLRFARFAPLPLAEEEAILVSTAYHSLYNSIVVGFLILWTALSAFVQ